ncbi:nonribosomal peptide synthase [Apiospora hydei]|uniref:Nonribosomal peptide synthase n=1 Tax=Apiospora hydei TaxID=1337664 RepID=A0ABR1X8Z0_9PEZI
MSAAQQDRILSLAAIGPSRLEDIAKKCRVPVSSIEDVYQCTPLQESMIAANRDEVFHFVLTSDRGVDVDKFCTAMRRVVAANAILRTRIVECDDELGGGLVQVVTNEDHVTNLNTGFGSVDEYLYGDAGAAHHFFAPGEVLFRSAFIGESLVTTMHHTIADYWSMDKMLQLDMPAVYFGQPPIKRPAFRDFVTQCLRVDRAAADGFWASRIRGSPAVFPAPPKPPTKGRLSSTGRPDAGGAVSEKPSRMMPLRRSAPGPGGISPSHMAFYIEAAWALTAAIYTDSDNVAYGYVISGRSPNPDAVENTLGPTVTEIPIQVSVPRRMTVEKLIKERAASWRHLQQNTLFLQYGLENISRVNEAAKAAAGFGALINIRPSVFTDKNKDTSIEGPDDIKLRMVWLRGYFPLQFIFSITEEGVMVWPRTNPSIVSDAQLDRILSQYEHILRLLTETTPQTKLGDLPLLDPQAQSAIVLRNNQEAFVPGAAARCIRDVFSGPALARALRSWDVNTTTPATTNGDRDNSELHTSQGGTHVGNTVITPEGCGIWITIPESVDRLAPQGGIGEVLVEGTASGAEDDAVTESLVILTPKWATSIRGEKATSSKFLRTGILAKYALDDDTGSVNQLSLIGRASNRIKFGGQSIQLEELERAIAARCDAVRDVVTATRIAGGRTVLVAVLCLADSMLPRGTVLGRLPPPAAAAGISSDSSGGSDDHATTMRTRVEAGVHAARTWAQRASGLPADRLPTIWLAVEELPRVQGSSRDVDRVAVQQWLAVAMRG